jgi:glutaredoxin
MAGVSRCAGELQPEGPFMSQTRSATLYRMVLPDHTCPFGVRAKQLLQAEGFEVDDHILRSREEVDAFKAERGVETTPLIEIDGETIGGADDLERYLAG